MSDPENYDESGPTNEETRRMRQRVEGLFRDVLKRTVSQGAGARQLTEETVRSLVNEMKLPREIAAFTLQQADTIKSEVVRVVAGEVRNFLEEANLGEELAKILTSLSFEVRTEIRFIPNDEALKPNVRSRIGVKTDRGEKIVEDAQSEEIDNAIRSTVTSLASRILSRVVGADEEASEPEEEDLSELGIGPAATHASATAAPRAHRAATPASAREREVPAAAKGTKRSTQKSEESRRPEEDEGKSASKSSRVRRTRAKSTPRKSSSTSRKQGSGAKGESDEKDET